MRATDGPSTRWRRLLVWWQRIGSTLVVAIALGIAAYAVHIAGKANDNAEEAVTLAKAQVRALALESLERRDQQCRISEQKQRADVDLLRQSYAFILHPPPGLADLVPIALAQLAKTEKDARLDDAPPFCDAPNVGEPEPDPVVPRRPKGIPEQTGGKGK